MSPLPTPTTPMPPAPRGDLAGRLLIVADRVEARVGELTAIIDRDPCPDAVAELAGLLWVAFMLRPLTAGARQRGKEGFPTRSGDRVGSPEAGHE